MKHITNEKYATILGIAKLKKDLVNGCRQKDEAEAREVIDLCKEYSTEAKNSPAEYKILQWCYTERGTKKYSDRRIDYRVYSAKKTQVRETEKSIIIDGTYKDVIPKEKIVCYIW